MNQSAAGNANAMQKRNAVATGRVRGLVLGFAFFTAGIALSALWFARSSSNATAPPESVCPPALTDATKTVLHRLGSPVEIRFYSMLDPASVGDSGREFSGRVDQLLSQYEQAAAGKIKVARVNSFSTSTAKSAEEDGVSAFNNDKGNACFLGIAVVCGGQKQSLSSLAPEWEQALEPDLSRAIAAVTASDPRSQPAPKADASSLEAVRRTIPNVDAVSVEEGSQMLRTAALAQFQKTGQEMQARVKQAEERFLQAQNNQSKSDQDAALKDLKQAQKEQTKKLEEIALESKAQLEAFQQLKGATR